MSKKAATWLETRPWTLLWAMIVLSLLVRVALIFWRQSYLADYARTDIGQIPYNLVAGLGYTYQGFPSSYFGPVYTYLWAGQMFLFGKEGGQLALQLLQALMLSLAPLFLYVFARHYFGAVAALFAAAWIAFYPELLVLSSTLYSDSLVLFLWTVILGIYAVLQTDRRGSLLWSVLLGVIIALLALAKGRMLIFSGLILAALFFDALRLAWASRPALSWRPILVPILAGLVAVAVIIPWTVRNYRTHDTFMPLESTMGFNLWLGHNEAATGTGKARLGNSDVAGVEFEDVAPGGARFPRPPELQQALANCTSEVACDDLYAAAAADFIVSNPQRELELSAAKFFYGWWFDPTSAAARHPLYRLPWIVSLLFFLVGAGYRLFFQRRPDLLLWAILLMTSFLQIVFFVVPRFRYPAYPVVFMLAAYGVVLLGRRLFSTRLSWIAQQPQELPR